MAALLNGHDVQVKQVALEFFKNIFVPELVPEGQTLTDYAYTIMLEEAGGIAAISACTESENASVANLAKELMETLTEAEEDDEDVESP